MGDDLRYVPLIRLNKEPGTPSVLFSWATLPLKPATIALKIGIWLSRKPVSRGMWSLPTKIHYTHIHVLFLCVHKYQCLVEIPEINRVDQGKDTFIFNGCAFHKSKRTKMLIGVWLITTRDLGFDISSRLDSLFHSYKEKKLFSHSLSRKKNLGE